MTVTRLTWAERADPDRPLYVCAQCGRYTDDLYSHHANSGRRDRVPVCRPIELPDRPAT